MKIGRPRKPDNEKKNCYVRVRLTQEENEILDECCDKLSANKTDVIVAGIYMVHDDLKNGNEDC